MSLLDALLERGKLAVTAGLLLAGAGVAAWVGMIRQEDPTMPDYWGQVQAYLPGADAERVERLLLEPIEEELAEVAQIKTLDGTAFSGAAVVEIELRDGTRDVPGAWDDVREALDRAEEEFPEGASRAILRDDLNDQESVVLAVTGDPDLLALERAADRLEHSLLRSSLVERVTRVADPGEQVTIALDDAEAGRLGLTALAVAGQLAERARIVPAGSIRVGDRSVSLRPGSDFASLEEIRDSPLVLPGGATVPLRAVAAVDRGPESPARSAMLWNGEPAVGLGVVPRPGINVVAFGDAVRRAVDELAPSLAPVEVIEVIDQPERVAGRLSDLGRSLLLGVAVVAGVLFLAMGLRLGLVVGSVVPIVVLSSLAVFAIGGGILHQISVAALVIALGMLVDNAIVVTEAIQWRLDRGETPTAAAKGAVRELLLPLATATGTTLAVFVPMMLAEGATAEFTRDIPIVIMITLTASYVAAVFFTPAVAGRYLRPSRRAPDGGFGDRLAEIAVRRRGWVLVGAAVLVGGSGIAAGAVRQEFFPRADRNQLLVEVELPEGSHLEATRAAAADLDRRLRERPEVVSVATFVGRSAPHFYYNLSQIPWSPHVAQLVVETARLADVDALAAWVRGDARAALPELEIVARPLQQGPPVVAPVELRLYGDDLARLAGAAERFVARLREAPGTADVRHTLGLGSPTLRFAVDDAAAARRGVGRGDVARALYGRTQGYRVGDLRDADDPVPILLRSRAGEDLALASLPAVDVARAGAPVPLGEVATAAVEWRPAAIRHRDRQRVVGVLAELATGAAPGDVLEAIAGDLPRLAQEEGVRVEVGGAAEGSGEANGAMLRALPIGILLLVGILMVEFDSFRRLALVLVTVPLAAAGVVPGLLIGDQPFGFMSLLGVIALVGVVVNNAIVLLDVIETERRGGASVEEAVRRSVARRVRPILLTTATTVAGLVPLALSPTSLWPPLAWAMISGLTASTLLTLLVVPALYTVLFPGPRGVRGAGRAVVGAAATLLLAAVIPGSPAAAEEAPTVSLAEVLAAAGSRPAVQAAEQLATAADEEAVALRRAGWWPVVEGGVDLVGTGRDLTIDTPIGSFGTSGGRYETATLGVAQPLFDPLARRYRAPAAELAARAGTERARQARHEAAYGAAERFFAVVAIERRLVALEALVGSLEARAVRVEREVAAGRALPVEAAKVRLARAEAEQEKAALAAQARVAARALGQAIGVDEPLRARWEAADSAVPAPRLAAEASRRPDLEALAAEAAALRLAPGAIAAEGWPRLEAVAALRREEGALFADREWAEGGLRVRWRPFAAGTRAPLRRAAEARAAAADASLEEARRAAQVEEESARADIEAATAALAVARLSVEDAGETVRVETVRWEAGRVTTNDLLDAEAALLRERTRRDLAEIELALARLRLALVTGRSPAELAGC